LVLVSGDSDLVPPLELICTDYPEKKIRIYFPPRRFSNDLNNILKRKRKKAVELEKNKPKFIKATMPDTVTKDGITYTIPPEWKVLTPPTSLPHLPTVVNSICPHCNTPIILPSQIH
jgi:hypothetical protein